METPKPYSRRKSVNMPLTEVRTVHSRAKTALRDMKGWPHYAFDNPPPEERDDAAEIKAALAKVVELLEPWERHPVRKTDRYGRPI